MTLPEISIIVPVYNVRKYLNRCIDSILCQTFDDFELIIVDDGSTDGSREICDEYLNKDSRVKVFHKENGGLSSARNMGIDMAGGKFLGFIDSDDYIEKDMYKVLYDDIIKFNADVSICGIYDIFKGRKVRQSGKNCKILMNSEEALKNVLESKLFSVNSVNKLFRKALFGEKVRFPVGKTAEDAFIVPLILGNSKRVVYNYLPLYNYERRANSITTSLYNRSDLDVIEAYSYHLDMVSKNFPKIRKQAEFRYIWSYIYVLDKMVACGNCESMDEYRKIADMVKRNTWSIMFNPCFSIKRKLSTIIFLMSEKLYMKFRNAYSSKNFGVTQ